MSQFIKKKYIALFLGDPKLNCHIDAIHSKGPNGEVNTRRLVKRITKNTGCSGIYALISRKKMDLNRPLNKTNELAIKEFRDAINSILKHLKILDEKKKLTKPYLHLAIHGMKDRQNKDIEIGTRYNQTCSKNVFLWFKNQLEKKCYEIFRKTIKIHYNQEFIGDKSKSVHRRQYGNLFNTI